MQEVGGYPNKRRRTRRALLRGAMKVIAEDGVDALTASSVCRAAGLSTGTLYNHFDGVDALGDAVAEELVTVLELGAEQLPGLSGDPAARLALGVLRVLELATADQVFIRAFVEAIGQRPAFRARIRQLVAREIATGVGLGVFDVPAESVAVDAVLGTALQALRSMLSGEVGDERLAVVHLVLRLLGVGGADIDEVVGRALAVDLELAG